MALLKIFLANSYMYRLFRPELFAVRDFPVKAGLIWDFGGNWKVDNADEAYEVNFLLRMKSPADFGFDRMRPRLHNGYCSVELRPFYSFLSV